MSTLWGGMIAPDPEPNPGVTHNEYQKAKPDRLQIAAVCMAGFIVWLFILCAMVPLLCRHHRQWLEARERLERGRR